MVVSNHWYNPEKDTNKHEDLNLLFSNHGEEDEISPLTTIEIYQNHKRKSENAKINKEGVFIQLIEDTKVLCKNDKPIIPASIRHRAAG